MMSSWYGSLGHHVEMHCASGWIALYGESLCCHVLRLVWRVAVPRMYVFTPQAFSCRSFSLRSVPLCADILILSVAIIVYRSLCVAALLLFVWLNDTIPAVSSPEFFMGYVVRRSWFLSREVSCGLVICSHAFY